VTCLYHGQPDPGLWPRLSAMATNYQFLPGVATGLALGLAHPCFGQTIAMRRETLEKIGGFTQFVNHLAEDYAIGETVRMAGGQVAIPPFTVSHAASKPVSPSLSYTSCAGAAPSEPSILLVTWARCSLTHSRFVTCRFANRLRPVVIAARRGRADRPTRVETVVRSRVAAAPARPVAAAVSVTWSRLPFLWGAFSRRA